ncbi:MAG: LamG-like jellyroll fold domain-containing protein [Bacteroidia bacterium]|nr:LamG-like jellyroll fold domain-containing protein [Bacteroidia bacterium]
MNRSHWICLGRALVLAGLWETAQAQQYQVAGYWNFEGAEWRKPAAGQAPAWTNGHLLRTEAEDGAAGRFLRMDRSTADELRCDLNLQGSLSVEFWFRYPEYDYNPEPRWLLFSDNSFYIQLLSGSIRFRTSVRDAAGKVHTQEDFQVLRGAGRNSPGYYFDGNWHHMVFKYDVDRGIKEIWVDGELPEGFSFQVAQRGRLCGNEACTKRLAFGYTPGHPWTFTGDLDELVVYDGFIPAELHLRHYAEARAGKPYTFTPPGSRPAVPPPQARSLPQADPKGLAPRMAAADQLRMYPLPRYRPGHTLMPLINWMEPVYLGGYKQPGISDREATRRSVRVQAELASHWGYALMLHNSATAASLAYVQDTTQFMGAWIRLANQHPEWPLAVTSFWPQIKHNRPGDPSRLPNIYRTDLPAAYYLRDRQGAYLTGTGDKTDKLLTISPAAPDEKFIEDGLVQRRNMEHLLSQLTRPIQLITENGEEPPLPGAAKALEADPAVVAHRARLGFKDWNTYQAAQKSRFQTLYSNQFRTLPQLRNTVFTWYGLDGGPLDRFEWTEIRKTMTPINGQYYSTPDFYPRWPENWRYWRGAWRGWDWLRIAREKEIQAGDRLFSPYIAAGWSLRPEDNLMPAQWLGLLKHLGVIGAEFYYTFHANEGKGGFADPDTYIWQAAMPAYAQALTSRYEDLLREGNVLRDAQGVPQIQHWAGDPRVLLTIRKHDREERYVMAANVNPMSNVPGNVEAETDAVFRLGNTLYRVMARRQGSVYLLDLRDPAAPVCVQLDSWHEADHPAYWKQEAGWEAEVWDAADKARIRTARPAGAEAGDFRRFTTWIDLETGAWAEYRAEVRETGSAPDELRIEAGPLAAKSRLQVLVDGKPAGKPVKLSGSGWRSVSVKLPPLPPGPHTVRLQAQRGGLSADSFVLRRR